MQIMMKLIRRFIKWFNDLFTLTIEVVDCFNPPRKTDEEQKRSDENDRLAKAILNHRDK